MTPEQEPKLMAGEQFTAALALLRHKYTHEFGWSDLSPLAYWDECRWFLRKGARPGSEDTDLGGLIAAIRAARRAFPKHMPNAFELLEFAHLLRDKAERDARIMADAKARAAQLKLPAYEPPAEADEGEEADLRRRVERVIRDVKAQGDPVPEWLVHPMYRPYLKNVVEWYEAGFGWRLDGRDTAGTAREVAAQKRFPAEKRKG